jgi:photosystem II stability/assembly factor-like uncharacterized protein
MRTTLHTAVALALGALPLAAQSAGDILASSNWRSIGPANFGGRIVDIEVAPNDRFTWYAVTGTGGIWKTTNNGQSFEVLFDEESAFSIGDLAIAPSNPEVLYVGTGEANNQRSSYWGNGVHKSTDGGKTWTHVGLDGTDHIGRVVIHPADPNRVYVAALGPLYSAGEHRGVYRTTNGGESWDLVKHIDADVGFVDIALHPAAPDTILAASYDRRRRAWDFRDEGPGSALWRSTDGGDRWTKVSGIADGDIGRIGVRFHPADPALAFAIVENNNAAPSGDGGRSRRGNAEEDASTIPADVDPELYPLGLGETEEAPGDAPAARPIGGEFYRSEDAGKSWTKVSSEPVGGAPHYYYGQLTLDPNDKDTAYVMGVRVAVTRDGGKSWSSNGFDNRLHVDHHAVWIDPADSKRALLGNDGGIGQTWDGGKSWQYHDDLPIGQFYAIAVDERVPYNIYGGTQDNGTWGIPSRSVTQAPLDHADAFKIGGGDGFYVQVDPSDPDTVYCESQFGGLTRVHLGTDARRGIRPRSARGQPELRFNWMSPLLISPHDPRTLYYGSQFLHRSEDRGDSWESISPDLTSADPDRLAGDVPHCTITTVDESPLQKGMLVVGTDDGHVWASADGGARWTEWTDRFEGVPARLWVSRVECSPHDADRVYVAFTGYREDDRNPYLFLSTDAGATFRPIANNLPSGASINVVQEHPRNPDCVLVGTEFGVHASLDAGATWHPLGSGLPTQPVHDLLVHPREEDVILGTHGRGFWVLDATVLAEANADVLRKPYHLYQPRDGRQTRRVFPTVRYPGVSGWSADRLEDRPIFRYHLRDNVGSVQLEVLDVTGEVVFTRRGETDPGVHEVVWSPGRGRGGRGARTRGTASTSGPGNYLLRMTVDGETAEHTFRVHAAPGAELDAAAGEEGELLEESFDEGERGDRDF